MNFTVYRQSSKERPDGTIIYKGEDARPYVGDNFMFVADGLGGAAAIRHQNFNKDMFNNELLPKVLFNDMEEYDLDFLQKNPEYLSYVQNSFFEFTSIKDCYFDNIYNIKKSGYFGSRIVSAVVLHEMLFDKFRKERKWQVEDGFLFDKYNEATDKNLFLSNLGLELKNVIKTQLKQIANNSNLYYETSYVGLGLLGTTLCATLFYEREDCVEAIYFVAGDSRPYVWNVDGLFQVANDQEGEDGGMTNYIKANEDGDFYIDCKYHKFTKPCILFNASDGCFDSKYFISQLAFEKLLLETIVSNSSIYDVQNSLTETFLEYGKHDDSSTISCKIFGYDDYSKLKVDAEKRLQTIKSEYFNVMQTLLEQDYSMKVDEMEYNCPENVKLLKENVMQLNVVKDYCKTFICVEDNVEYTEKVKKVEEKTEKEKAKLTLVYDALKEVITNNSLLFLGVYNKSLCKEKELTFAQEYKKKSCSLVDEFNLEVQKNLDKIKSSFEYFTQQLKEVGELGLADITNLENIDIKSLSCGKDSFDKVYDFLRDIKFSKNDILKKLSKLRTDYERKNKETVKELNTNFDDVVNYVIENSTLFLTIDLFEKDKILFDENIKTYREITANISRIKMEEENKIFDELYPSFWERNYKTIMQDVIDKKIVGIGESILNSIAEFINVYVKTKKENEIMAEQQKALFNKYDDNYYKLIRG